jgi:SAM-dependent methyltransferase
VADAAAGRVAGSFRDRAGFVFERDGVLYRQVNRSFADTWDAVVGSGLYDALHAQGLLVAHDVVDTSIGTDDAHVVIRPDRIPFVSFPYEWSPGQLRDAALLTLRIQDIAIEHGMTLRDASAYNVQLRRGRPVFIDTLSFAPWEEGTPWVAYGQFCEQFLAPLVLQTRVDHRLRRLLVADVGGVPLDLAAALAPSGTKLKPGLLTHLHMHARARSGREVDPDEKRKQARFSRNAMIGLIRGLRKSVEGLTWDPSGTTWADYDETAQHYDDQARRAKTHAVKDAIDRVEPGLVWDLGANTGRFASLAAKAGATAIAFDLDAGAVERGWQRVSADPPTTGDVLPLVLDLANPSPALGWAQAERPSLKDRGPADLVLALALVHHLAIGNNVPLPDVVAYLASLGRHLLVEWVPRSDSKVRVLLATREDVFDDYTEHVFNQAVAQAGDVLARTPVSGTDRELVLLRTRVP